VQRLAQNTYDPMLSRAPVAPRSVLVVDDSRAQRKILTASLLRRGYHVMEAASGEEALERCRQTRFDIILSDWVMPGMSGIEFCQAFRAMPRETYGYFILLTSRTEKGEAARGLDAGADDFLAKPVDSDELHARITAGERILRMERELTDKNHLIGKALAEIQKLYSSLDRDLVEARRLQQSLVKERHRDFGAATVSLLLRPSGHVGGDLVGFFPIGEISVGLFAIDVSGHGVTSAIMTARLAGVLSGAAPERNIALMPRGDGTFVGRQPCEIAAALNAMLLDDIQTDQYLTMLYAELDLTNGNLAMVQAGHPHPAMQRADGRMEYLGTGGPPIGLLADATYETFHATLSPGDRLFAMSDGFTECVCPAGHELGEDGLAGMITSNAPLVGMAFLDAMVWDLQAYAGGKDFRDDVSAFLIEYRGPPGAS
jgi:phosphoserine phosphatase RsbU/P